MKNSVTFVCTIYIRMHTHPQTQAQGEGCPAFVVLSCVWDRNLWFNLLGVLA